jgi:hypothetical protein
MAKKRLVALILCVAGYLARFDGPPAFAESAAINDCLIVAAKAQSELDTAIWSRLLVVRYGPHQLQHVYLVYAGGADEILCFDSIHGTQLFHTGARTASTLAQLIDPRATYGWYVEENTKNRSLFAQQR